jgi:hypothetical protein
MTFTIDHDPPEPLYWLPIAKETPAHGADGDEQEDL